MSIKKPAIKQAGQAAGYRKRGVEDDKSGNFRYRRYNVRLPE